ncbi:TATA-binding protein-associated factor mot [Salix suchowensis]|nr:TATA-binding protein-associated factor mot [Salix suchowensis]
MSILRACSRSSWRPSSRRSGRSYTRVVPEDPPHREISPRAATQREDLAALQSNPPAAYHEMALTLSRIHADCIALLHSFASDCKLPISSIPFLGNEIDITGSKEGQTGKNEEGEVSIIADKRTQVVASIERYIEVKGLHDIRVAAAFAASFVAFKSTPDKVSPVVKGLMNGIKDIEQTPTFAYTRKTLQGILSFQASSTDSGVRNGKFGSKGEKPDALKADEASKSRLSRRGACLAFAELSTKFGPRLFSVIPNMWQSMVGGLLSACASDSPDRSDALIEKQYGQDVIDSLSVLEAVVPALHEDLWPKLVEIYPMVSLALRSRFAIMRQCAARCFATVCDVMTADAMQYVVETILPLLGDPLVLSNRQGATELIYRK